MARKFLAKFFSDTEFPSDLSPFSPVNPDSESNAQDPNPDTKDPVVDDEYIIKIDKVTGEDPFRIEEETKTVLLDPTRGDWADSKGELKRYWAEEKERVFTESAFELYLSIQVSKGDVDEVMEFFDPILTPSQSSMLEEAYHLSKYFDNFDVDSEEEHARRGDLSDKYDDAAMNVPSLCSAGYFEKLGLFRDLYDQLSESDTQDEDFQDLFDKLIRHRPFVVFVKGGTGLGVGELRDLISQKSNHLDKLSVDIDYIHVRGIGGSSHRKIKNLRDELDKEGAKQVTEVNRKENGPNELVLAVDVSSI